MRIGKKKRQGQKGFQKLSQKRTHKKMCKSQEKREKRDSGKTNIQKNVGKSREAAEKLDAFADPKRQMTENNNKKEKRRKKTYRKNKRDNTGSGGREASWQGEGAWTRVYFNANICLFLNGFCYLLFPEGGRKNVNFRFVRIVLSQFWLHPHIDGSTGSFI